MLKGVGRAGYECGLVFEGFDQMQELDIRSKHILWWRFPGEKEQHEEYPDQRGSSKGTRRDQFVERLRIRGSVH